MEIFHDRQAKDLISEEKQIFPQVGEIFNPVHSVTEKSLLHTIFLQFLRDITKLSLAIMTERFRNILLPTFLPCCHFTLIYYPYIIILIPYPMFFPEKNARYVFFSYICNPISHTIHTLCAEIHKCQGKPCQTR